jgi:DNA-binding transcriptional MocR family regulator
MFVWARLRADLPLLPTQDWVDFGLRHKVLVVPGAAFSISNAAQPWLRLSFANPSPAALQHGAERLSRGLQGLAARTHHDIRTTQERTSS